MDALELKEAMGRLAGARPLVHHITNLVVAHGTADLTLAMGGSPIMAHAQEEAEEITSRANALLLNLGTPSNDQLKAMELSGLKAQELGTPVILDPVGAGASAFRTKAALRLIQTVKPSVIRSNLGEAFALLQEEVQVKGVESLLDDQDLALRASKSLAVRFGCISAITGEVDVVSDGLTQDRIAGGSLWLKHITGSGCMATTSIACFLAVEPPFRASVLGLTVMKRASELAGNAKGPGSFKAALLDAIHHLRKMP